ncbi:Exonuclease Mut-7-like, partial [Manis pentadactyla]
ASSLMKKDILCLNKVKEASIRAAKKLYYSDDLGGPRGTKVDFPKEKEGEPRNENIQQ